MLYYYKQLCRIGDYFLNNNSQEYLSTLLQSIGIKELTSITGSVQDVEIIEEKAMVGIPAVTIPLENQQVTIIEEQRKITIDELKKLELYKKMCSILR